MILADNHCHISKEYFEDPLKEIFNLIKETELQYVSVMGVDITNDEEYVDLKKRFLDILASNKDLDKDKYTSFLKIGVGLHPEEVIKLGKYSSMEFDRVKNLISNNIELVDYIGEIGIDLTYDNSKKNLNNQKDIFTKFCDLSIDLQKPVSIHSRGAIEFINSIIEDKFPAIKGDEFGKIYRGELHCFTYDFDTAKFYIDRGFRLGIGGVVTFKKSEDLRNVVRSVREEYLHLSDDSLFSLETDTPYLSPEPYRGKPNSPRNIKVIKKFLDDLFKQF